MAEKNIQQLFDKPMDRRQFLAHIGAGLLVLVGVSGLLSQLVHYGQQPSGEEGYGETPYGGDTRS